MFIFCIGIENHWNRWGIRESGPVWLLSSKVLSNRTVSNNCLYPFLSVLSALPVNCPIMLLGHNGSPWRISDNLTFISILYVQIITQSDFHSNPFGSFMHTPSRKLPLLWVILLRSELCPFIIIIPISHPFDYTHVPYISDTLHIIRWVFKPQFIHYTKYANYVSFAVQYIYLARVS